MVSKNTLCLIAVSVLPLCTLGQNAPRIAPIPSDPLEMVSGPVQPVDTPASRDAVVQLLIRARTNYALRTASQGYDLKVAFTVNSHGQTDYDGAWQMEDLFDPKLGLRWTAKAEAGYATTQISSQEKYYGDGTSDVIPLRLQEARAALFGAIPTGNFNRAVIRTSTATFNGAPVTCVLISGSRNATAPSGRSWDETEECIDPQSGLLKVHSQVPGRYFAYDYTHAPQLGGHILPSKVTVTEGGKTVSEINVESLTNLPSANGSLFVPTQEMQARGPSVMMAEAQKLSGFSQPRPFPAGATVHPVCVFGLVTPSGQLVEAHSLQPSDPNSQAAVEEAKRMDFFYPKIAGERPRQHFVFVIEKYVSAP